MPYRNNEYKEPKPESKPFDWNLWSYNMGPVFLFMLMIGFLIIICWGVATAPL